MSDAAAWRRMLDFSLSPLQPSLRSNCSPVFSSSSALFTHSARYRSARACAHMYSGASPSMCAELEHHRWVLFSESIVLRGSCIRPCDLRSLCKFTISNVACCAGAREPKPFGQRVPLCTNVPRSVSCSHLRCARNEPLPVGSNKHVAAYTWRGGLKLMPIARPF